MLNSGAIQQRILDHIKELDDGLLETNRASAIPGLPTDVAMNVAQTAAQIMQAKSTALLALAQHHNYTQRS